MSETLSGDSWDRLTECLEAFVEAWEAGQGTPQLDAYVPAEEGELQSMAIAELVKVDIEYRFARGEDVPTLEEYLRRYPDLDDGDGPPSVLIYEEFHLRRARGESVTLSSYYERFPKRRAELEQLADLRAAQVTQSQSDTRPEKPLDLVLEQEIDDFQLLQELGAGAFAKVYLARQRSMDRRVALKVSRQGTHEPRTLAQLNHPNIIRVFDQKWLKDRGLRLVYMEYAAGGTLKSLVDHRRACTDEATGRLLLQVVDQSATQHDPLWDDKDARRALEQQSWYEVVCKLGLQLAEALEYAHAQHILHRDIKPANVLLDAHGSPKLADFNIAFGRDLEGAAPAAYFGGSPAYMPPEQLKALDMAHEGSAADLDERTDIFSLGAVIWELYTGSRPYPDLERPGRWASLLPQLIEQRSKPPEPPAEMPAPLKRVLLKCMAPETGDRYENTGQLKREVQLLLAPEVHKLLHPPPRHWTHFVLRWPLFVLTFAALIPNILLSVPNLIYNISELVEHMDEAAFFFWLVPINLVAWLGSAFACIYCAIPILRGTEAIREQRLIDAEQSERLNHRCLTLGSNIALIVGLAWFASGIAFPAVAGSTPRVFLHFLVSQIVHGVIVAGLCYFAETFLVARAILPRFVAAEFLQTGRTLDTESAKVRTSWFSAVLGATPLLAIAALGMIGAKSLYFSMLAVLGVVSFLVSLGVKPLIHRDLDRLAEAVSPGALRK